VEQGIATHREVAEVPVFPVSSPLGEGEGSCVVMFKAGMNITEAELIEHCQRNMSYFMVSRYVNFFSDMPRSGTHTVEKYKLQREAQADLNAYRDREKAGIVLRRKYPVADPRSSGRCLPCVIPNAPRESRTPACR